MQDKMKSSEFTSCLSTAGAMEGEISTLSKRSEVRTTLPYLTMTSGDTARDF